MEDDLETLYEGYADNCRDAGVEPLSAIDMVAVLQLMLTGEVLSAATLH